MGITIGFTNAPNLVSSTPTTFTVNGTLSISPAMILNQADNIQAQVSFNGATNQATSLQLTPNEPATPQTSYSWTATLPYSSDDGGQLAWVIILVTPPDNSQPKSNAAQYLLPTQTLTSGSSQAAAEKTAKDGEPVAAARRTSSSGRG